MDSSYIKIQRSFSTVYIIITYINTSRLLVGTGHTVIIINKTTLWVNTDKDAS